MNIHLIMNSLSKRRPIFHSESDFQHELAWLIHEVYPDAEIRLEKPHIIDSARRYIDLVVTLAHYTYFIELKYKTSNTSVNLNNEYFDLKQQGAKDQGSYDFLKDIQRIEHSILNNKNYYGYAIMLSNDSKYWLPSSRNNILDREFRLLPGRELEGKLSWAPHAGKGSIEKRESPIVLSKKYKFDWNHYSKIINTHEFKYLIIEINNN